MKQALVHKQEYACLLHITVYLRVTLCFSVWFSCVVSFAGEDGNESQDVTMVKKDDFDQIVAVFVEMLRQDPAVRETSLARMDHGIR